MEAIWDNVFFNELRDLPSEHPVLLADHRNNQTNDSQREKVCKTMFEKYDVPAFFI